MKLPIIVIAEETDILFFQTIKEAQDDLEPIDVEEGIYCAYDANGNRLSIKITERKIKTPWWLGGGYSVTSSVVMTESRTVKKDTEVLMRSLKRYFKALSEEQPEKFPDDGDGLTLEGYINLARKYSLFSRWSS